MVVVVSAPEGVPEEEEGRLHETVRYILLSHLGEMTMREERKTERGETREGGGGGGVEGGGRGEGRNRKKGAPNTLVSRSLREMKGPSPCILSPFLRGSSRTTPRPLLPACYSPSLAPAAARGDMGRCIDGAHTATGLLYLTFAVLGVVSIVVSQQLFRDGCQQLSESTIYCPIHFCGLSSAEATVQAAIDGNDVGCFDKRLIGMLVPTSTVLSIVAIIMHSIFLLLARCRGGACGLSHSFNDGVVAGMAFALVFLLFVTALVLLAVAIVGQYFVDYYGDVREMEGKSVRVKLSGNIHVLFAAGAFGFVACILTVMESVLLCRREMQAREPAESKDNSGASLDAKKDVDGVTVEIAQGSGPADAPVGSSATANPFGESKEKATPVDAPADAPTDASENPFKNNAHLTQQG